MAAKHVAAEWASYAERVLPKDAPPVQVQETRRAFYAGGAAILFRLLRLLESGDEPTPADLQMMDDIEAELAEFGRDIQAGRR